PTPEPTGGNYLYFDGVRVNDAGQVAFWAMTSPGAGIFRSDGTTTVSIARVGGSWPSSLAPGGGAAYSEVAWDRMAFNSSGQVAYWAALNNGRQGLLLHNGTASATLALHGTPAPGGGNYIGAFGNVQLNPHGEVAYFATPSGGAGMFLHDGTTGIAIARQGMTTPAGGTYTPSFTSFSTQVNANGQVLYVASVTGGPSTDGIFLHDGTTGEAIALRGAAAPGGGAYDVFAISILYPQLNAAGQVAYWARLTGGPSTDGIFLHDGTTDAALALQGAAAPGTTGTFDSFFGAGTTKGSMLINNMGLVVLRAALALGGDVTAANDTGFWFGTNASDLSLLVREGDSLLVNGAHRTLGQLPLQFSLSDTGIAWMASFTDGTQAVMYSQFPLASIPEVGAWAMLLLPAGAAAVVAGKRRSRRARARRARAPH
ncbi:MAG TPA: hypothetical protein PJ982_04370, partial [Lacipirellulaceae bacterium]|nr:hypothetical protein [Lacipirellulaceae bacterium]